MPNQIDEISKALGGLQADITHIRGNSDAANAKLDTLHTSSIKQEIKIDAAHRRIDEILPFVNAWREWQAQNQGEKNATMKHAAIAGAVVSALAYLVECALKYFAR